MFYIAFKNAVLIFLIILIFHFFLKNQLIDKGNEIHVDHVEDFDNMETEQEEPVSHVSEEIARDEDMLFNFVNNAAIEKKDIHEQSNGSDSNDNLGTFSSSSFAMYGSASY
jgi:hypothetical protein